MSFTENKRRSLLLYILLTGIVAGTLDISAAMIQYRIRTGGDPVNVLHFVAGGLIGPRAFEGGPAIPFIGLLVHYCIAFAWVILFFLTYARLWSKIPTVLLRAVIYGVLVYLLMNFAVLPLTSAPAMRPSMDSALREGLILVLCIALPAAVGAGRYFRAAD